MKVNQLKKEDIFVGIKIRSLTNPDHIATVVRIDKSDDYYAWIQWPEDNMSYSGFYGSDCECEIVED